MKFTIYDLRFTRRSSRREEALTNSRFDRRASFTGQLVKPSADNSPSPGGEGRGGGERPTNIVRPLSNPHSAFRIPHWPAFFLFPFSFFLAIAAFIAPAQSTNDSATTDFSSFQVIVNRNIFNPDRYGGTSYVPRSYSVPTFSLAGTMSYRKGMFAFFNGTSDEYRKALQQGGKIAGYTVGKITFDSVQLESSGKTNEMKVGAAMRREGDKWELSAPGEWGDLSAGGTGTASGNETTGQTSTNASLPSSGEQNDILKRLMEKREQELK